MPSILVLIGDPAFREKVCGEIAGGLRCAIYTASDAVSALSLLQAERPTILILTAEFSTVHGKPIAELVSTFSPGTAVLFLNAPARAARKA